MTTISDCISLKLINDNNLLAGVGNEIRFFTKDKCSTLPFKLKGKIHGIESSESSNQILVYGEKEFILIQQESLSFKLLYRGQLSDWINSGKLLQEADTFVLVTSHSVAIQLKYDEANQTCEIKKKISCTDKSTLYSSFIHGSSWDSLLILGGNAFGELLIWQPTIRSCEDLSRAELLQRLPCHNGVIFSIDLDLEEKILVTTSDDRSVRFWDVSLSEDCDFRKTKITSSKSGYSHVARVFKAKIIHEDDDIYVLTGGEDSYFCLWSRKGELLYKRRHQFGATIWSLDYHSPTKTILTAGSSGNILTYGLQDCFKNTTSFRYIESQTLTPNEYIAKIKFLNETHLIGMTSKNRLMYRSIDDKTSDWIHVNSYASTKCTVFEVHKGMIAIASYQRVTIYNYQEDSLPLFKEIFVGNVLPGVIRSFVFLSQSEFLVSDESGNCKLIRSDDFKNPLNINLPECKERWITAACLVDSEFLVVSNRQGNLILYSISEAESQETSKQCDIIKHLHGHIGCTTITLIKNESSFAILKTTGHDSSVKTIRVAKEYKTFAFISREMVPISWVEKVILSTKNNPELLFGFNDNHFVLWSREMDTHFEIYCGGGHRSWDLSIDLPENVVRAVFIKNRQVIIHQKQVFNNSTLSLNITRNKWHVKPCNVLSYCGTYEQGFIVSGGEDNMLKISKFNVETGELTQLHAIYSHISSIRGLVVKSDISEKSHCIYSCGGRAQICTASFSEYSDLVEEQDYSIQKEFVLNEISRDPETRVMSIDGEDGSSPEIYVGCSDGYVRKLKIKDSKIFALSETWYGRCILHVRKVGKYLLSVATDGIVCFWDTELKEVVFKVKHHNSGVNSFDVRLVGNEEFHIITGGDDQDVVYSKICGCCRKGEKFEVLALKRMNYLHTAQVTAVKFTQCMKYFYSSSVDQVVRKVSLDTFLSCWEEMSCVADIKGIELVGKSQRPLVYGCGLQVL